MGLFSIDNLHCFVYNGLMNDLLITDQSHPDIPPQMRPEWAVKAVDHLMKMVKEKPMWEVIDFIVSVWAKKEDRVADFEKQKDEMKQTRANAFASNADMNLRYLAEIPMEISDLIENFYSEDISAMGKKEFWREFVKRYKYFQISEKL